MKIISWNCGRRPAAWSEAMASGADVLLLQEAPSRPIPSGWRVVAPSPDVPWQTGGRKPRAWSVTIAVREAIDAEPVSTAPLERAEPAQLGVSRTGTIAAAVLTLPNQPRITVASIYAPWEGPVSSTGGSWIYADASAHRIISDLSGLIGRERGHRLLIAGDWNVLRGYGEHGSEYWRGRYATVFARMDALGLQLVGPFAGRRPEPWPAELPLDSNTTPTYWPRGRLPSRQLDFVFASTELAPHVCALARNGSDWASDHCQVEITLASDPEGNP
jgi:Endonuclease/Exonuclease/phosphatase family